MKPPALVLDDVAVELGGAPVLHGVSCTVEHGAWLAVVGPNGAGKSTLLRAAAGLLAVRGDVRLDGVPITRLDRRQRARQVALVAQSPTVPPGLSVAHYVLLGRTPHLRPMGAEGPHDLAVVDHVLRRLELRHMAARAIDTLSGGEQQQGRLLGQGAGDADPLLLDEPTTALDVGHQQEVLELVDELRRDQGLTVVTTLHDLTLAAQYADRMLLLDRGVAVAEGTSDEVLTEEHLARFSGARVRVVRDGDAIVIVPVRWDRDERVERLDGADPKR